MRRMLVYIQLVFILLVLFPLVSAIEAITPSHEDVLLTKQPLFSWTDYAGSFTEYEVILSKNSDLSTQDFVFTSTQPYVQAQNELDLGVWYWQVNALESVNDSVSTLESSAIFTFSISTPTETKVQVDLSNYDNNKQVDFLLVAELGSSVDVVITKEGFNLPFSTTDLQVSSFSAFLDPGTYNVDATFTYLGVASSFSDSFVIEEELEEQILVINHTVSFNVFDQDNNSLEDVNVSLENDEYFFSAFSNADGDVSFVVPEGIYTVLGFKDGYEAKTWKQTVLNDTSLRLQLDSLDNEDEKIPQEKEIPESLSTTSITDESEDDVNIVIGIDGPSENAEVSDEFTVSFSLSPFDAANSCDVQLAVADSSEWQNVGKTGSPSDVNSVPVLSSIFGDAKFRVKCVSSSSSESFYSVERKVHVLQKADKEQLVHAFIEKINELNVHDALGDDPIIKTLPIKNDITDAKKTLSDLQQQYESHIDKNQVDLANEKKTTITQKIDEFNKKLVASVKFLNQEDRVVLFVEEDAQDLLDEFISNEDLDTNRQEKLVSDYIVQRQGSYSARTTMSVVQINHLDGSEKFLTGVTRTVQSFDEDEALEDIVVLEHLPSEVIQLLGTPQILVSGGKSAEVGDSYAKIPLTIGDSYTLLFTGNVDVSFLVESSPLIIEPYDVTSLEEASSFMSKVSGYASFDVSETDLSYSIILWIILTGFIIVGVFKNPVYNYSHWTNKKRLGVFTTQIHQALDLLKQGKPELAFRLYPAILNSYDLLSFSQRQQYSFAIQQLHSSLDVYSFNQLLNEATVELENARNHMDLQSVWNKTNHLLGEYHKLLSDAKTQVNPQLSQLQMRLREKQAFIQQYGGMGY